jgi:short-chain fatty acids transporter
VIEKLGRRLSEVAERWAPDPFVLAIVLTVFVLVMGVMTGSAVETLPISDRLSLIADGWYAELWSGGLMKFAMQMCLVLITGHGLAMTSAVQSLIQRVAGSVKSAPTAVLVVALVACLASLVQWGLGAIAGAFMAREVGRAFKAAGRPIHYPLLGAAGYAGFLVWHGGFSGSAPLKVAEPGHFLEASIGVIPISQTLLSPLNLAVTGTLIVLIPLTFFFMMPRDPALMKPYPGEVFPSDPRPETASTASSRALNLVAAFLAGAFLVHYFMRLGVGGWNLDSINLVFLSLGIALHRSPAAYMESVVDGVRGCAGIIIQFPIYFGILGILKSSGLIIDVSQLFLSVATPNTYLVLTFFSAGIVNFFVPSGGGQWAVQGPVMMQGVGALAITPAKVVMALAYGDAWTNMLQPFWALPLLGIMGLQAREIMGYTSLVLLISGPCIVGFLLVL